MWHCGRCTKVAKALHPIADRGEDLAAALDVGKSFKHNMADITVLAKLAKTFTKGDQTPHLKDLATYKEDSTKNRARADAAEKH